MSVKCTMILGDCLDAMQSMPTSRVNMAFADLPYTIQKNRAATRNNWDTRIPLHLIWDRFKRLAAQTMISVFSCQTALASELHASNTRQFLYDLIWHKTSSATFLQAKRRPLCYHETLLVFRRGAPKYNPIMRARVNGKPKTLSIKKGTSASFGLSHRPTNIEYRDVVYPSSVLAFPSVPKAKSMHPTQKPVPLLEWLIRTYSNPGDVILDPVSGSGTTAVSALQNGRHVTCVEKDLGFFEASVERVRKHVRDNAIDAEIEVHR